MGTLILTGMLVWSLCIPGSDLSGVTAVIKDMRVGVICNGENIVIISGTCLEKFSKLIFVQKDLILSL
jgi:hypothetical protein